MKILHTADWHIGKKLHKHELSEDFELFIAWLCDFIEKEAVDVLLISGDVFDLANPSSEARKQYYRALMRLRKLDCKLVITGGNHDSPSMLDAPQEILRELEMHVIGGLPENMEELLIPIKNKKEETELVIAALPYLRDADLRSAADGQTYEDRLEAIRAGIQQCFENAADLCRKNYPGIPTIAMGHLFAAGAETSESEREIQIGNLAAFNANQFGDYFNYIALGHIHKPQKLNSSIPTYYSGSPLPLSFSERKDNKRVLLLNTENGWEPENIPVPAFRSLLKISGSLEDLELKLRDPGDRKNLESLIEVELTEENYDAAKILQLDTIVSNFELEGFRIVKHRVNFRNRIAGASEIYQEQKLEDLKPREVFLELISRQEYDDKTKEEILSAFEELLGETYQNENL
ncbi:MAG: exonuclease SbcCD subunit D C-terminal domain-containing protein [Salegentibacter sp.]|uniref:Nuclease SbcCD subunit D n=1 Tax=Salegentibacter flavus TaxID=287099 RepID=A0A1I4YZ94_9FLAO|nr:MULTISPECIES: exonuclease SbcCD subunit D C-terminal domain-containing protein [Salegentibacter]MDR9458168.1 exonuclease SbcCD subunit D C-terminal domain-containing protein [Salegentibacter sp.]SFN43324.1 Exodeoxyribonuclease I subunit D [Salegentibacter flavus]